ncbi:MAG: hypothetical protein UU81_C0001G0029 [Microgenomates group bacterium GW2011_GWC1_41_8]|uniref:Glycosyltransferase RgtA/B/C/D-like domain-containing protein n=2 Tax=Candidatus Roizmaniibacteriota TaxID=1752723 RepID=A0A0G0T799_9BACT|nr:MAG: hypothetical protein UU14_C0001G0021 [Candidatus Roizmanbacteria bacterium GW2011_GWB1_40_7]KKR94908.1 MAG: hypothetical protein UU41_C0002G0029 [Candidatus Roizmanbacteria bacterium GW2011_GWA1_41_13]KKS24874.1 MAG: hypothetical protein UU81_C0001G0029 [Microgenomates group bacterium GW2011_GWC1_41_8]OGK48712.1 MAG: hypothetical protein A3A55_03210 [Candidatus Roizmanbacteria bacterium RIFCSPLOWO2_01_FULL_40_14]
MTEKRIKEKPGVKAIATRLLPFIVPVLFFIVSLSTLSDYGMNSDSPVHFARGQAFLRYFMTGKTDFDGLPPYCIGVDDYNSRVDFETKEVCDRTRKNRTSEFEHIGLDYNFFKTDIYGHPPLSDIFSAATNKVFFATFGLLEDIDSYHLYILLSTLLLAIVISVWVNETYGFFASVVSVFALYLFPLLLAEQHFNIKDPPMAAFLTISLYFFWKSFHEEKPRYLLWSALAGGISFATKFNYVFVPVILLPWLFALFYPRIRRPNIVSEIYSKKNLVFMMMLVLFPIILFTVFYLSWPVLWSDPVHHVLTVFKFYKDIGTNAVCGYPILSPGWFLKCSNPVPLQYFVLTLPLVTLAFFSIGILTSLIRFRKDSYVAVLWMSFLFFTLLRVTIPGSSIYGGIRQIIEFIAPTAMIAGIGGLTLRNILVVVLYKGELAEQISRKTATIIISLIVLLAFVPILVKMYRIHPNENVYFNPLIGGLKGAAEKKIPFYISTYANPYLQGVKWLNTNAQPNSRLTLVNGVGQNISRGQLREDILYAANAHRSGYNQDGEYHILLVQPGDPTYNMFRYLFVEKFLDPLYVVNVEGVPILKIWKNDPAHVKKGINISEEQREKFKISSTDPLVLELSTAKQLKRIEVIFSSEDCKDALLVAPIFTSEDGKIFQPVSEHFNDPAFEEVKNYKADGVALLTGERARFIAITPLSGTVCNLSDVDFTVVSFVKLM